MGGRRIARLASSDTDKEKISRELQHIPLSLRYHIETWPLHDHTLSVGSVLSRIDIRALEKFNKPLPMQADYFVSWCPRNKY